MLLPTQVAGDVGPRIHSTASPGESRASGVGHNEEVQRGGEVRGDVVESQEGAQARGGERDGRCRHGAAGVGVRGAGRAVVVQQEPPGTVQSTLAPLQQPARLREVHPHLRASSGVGCSSPTRTRVLDLSLVQEREAMLGSMPSTLREVTWLALIVAQARQWCHLRERLPRPAQLQDAGVDRGV